MAKITPFRGTRPVRDKVHLVASRSYVSYTPSNLRGKLDTNPFSFIHIINPEYNKPGRKSRGIEKFRKIRERYLQFIESRVFQRDENPAYYLYEQRHHNHSYLGVIAGVSVEDYHSGRILKHEATLQKREKMFAQYLGTTGFNAEPVLLAHRNSHELKKMYLRICSERPEYEFTTADRAEHRLWVIDHPADIDEITRLYSGIEELYIADGHHRTASSARLYQSGQSPAALRESSAYFMALLIAEDSLHIDSFYRLLQLEDLHLETLLKNLEKDFIVESIQAPPTPENTQKHEFSMYCNGQWYLLRLRQKPPASARPIEKLDAEILTNFILAPHLGIRDLRSDSRITFEPGYIAPEEIAKRIDRGSSTLAFGLHPVEMAELKNIADSGCIMPPKSTYIEPKLRSGLIIYDLNEPL